MVFTRQQDEVVVRSKRYTQPSRLLIIELLSLTADLAQQRFLKSHIDLSCETSGYNISVALPDILNTIPNVVTVQTISWPNTNGGKGLTLIRL